MSTCTCVLNKFTRNKLFYYRLSGAHLFVMIACKFTMLSTLVVIRNNYTFKVDGSIAFIIYDGSSNIV